MALKQIGHKRLWLGLTACLLVAAVGGYLLFYAHAATNTPAIYSPQPGARFITTAHSGGQFTDSEYQTIASQYSYVLIDKQHDGNNINAMYDAVRELKRLNPSLNVSTYWESKFWLSGEKTSWQEPGYDPGFNEAWLLRDNAGNLIPQNTNKDGHFFFDLTNPDFRNWALAQFQHRMAAAPWDGIHFDSAYDLSDSGPGNKNWTKLIGTDRMAAYNAGTKDLFTRTKAMFPTKLITFNGLNGTHQPGRSLDKLDYLDGATDEAFCVNLDGSWNPDILADIKLMQTYSNKKLFWHTNYSPNELPSANAAQVGRYCHAAFMMGWQPGSSYHDFAYGLNSYITTTFAYELPELTLNIGNPTEAAQTTGSLMQRGFTNGRIYVNLGSSPASFTLPAKLVQFEDGKQLATYSAGSSFTLGAQSGAYFVNESFVGTAKAQTVTNNPANSNGLNGNKSGNKGSVPAPASAQTKGLSGFVTRLSDDIAPVIPKKSQKWVLLGIVIAASAASLVFGIPWVRRGGHKKLWANLQKRLRRNDLEMAQPLHAHIPAEHAPAHHNPHPPGSMIHPDDTEPDA